MKAIEPGGAAPVVTWLTDPDERLSPAMLLKDNNGRIFTVCSPASQLLPAFASTDYGVRELLTPVLLIAAGSDSRFVKLFLEGYQDQPQEMRQILDHLHLPLAAPPSEAPPADAAKTEVLLAAVEKNIDFQVRQALDRYGDRVAGGRLLIAGGVIDQDNAYGHGTNQLVLININGETDPQKMRLMREVATIGQQYAQLLGRARAPAAAPPQEMSGEKKKMAVPAAAPAGK